MSAKVVTKVLVAIAAVVGMLTPTLTASAAPAGAPTVISVDNKRPGTGGGVPITITGTNLGTVTSVAVDNTLATVTSKSATSLTFAAPMHALGTAVVLLTNPAGTANFTITYSVQRRALVPRPTLPATLKVGKSYTINGQDKTWRVSLTLTQIEIGKNKYTTTAKNCSVKGNVVKALKKGNCSLTIDINPDPITGGSNPNWRAKQFVDGITIN